VVARSLPGHQELGGQAAGAGKEETIFHLPFSICHLSFVIGEFNYEVQTEVFSKKRVFLLIHT
jgi:hypothetical protein